jgi:hypothetical protein
MSIAFRQPTIEDERQRLRKLSDKELIREGKAARFLCSPRQNYGKKPPEPFVIGLRLCIEEWRRRRPKDQAET